MAGGEYRNVGDHPEDLHDGRVVGVGDMVELTGKDLEESHNKRLVEEGILISTSGQGESEKRTAKKTKDEGGD